MNRFDPFIDPQTGALPSKTLPFWVHCEGITATTSDAMTLIRFVRNKRDAWLRDGKCLPLKHDSQVIQSLTQEMHEELLGEMYFSPRGDVSPER